MSKFNDKNAFLDAVSDIKPLKQDKVSVTDKHADALNAPYRKKVAESYVNRQQNFLTDGEVESVLPEAVLSYKLAGVQPQVFKKLKQGKYAYQYHLDLHQNTVAQSREKIYQLIVKSLSHGYRCLLITHGKGAKSNPPARIKSYVNYWLKQIDQVLAFHSALPQNGGTGSVYVLLKKNPQAIIK